MKKRTVYEASFKEEAVKLSNEIGVSKSSINLGVPENTIRNWIKLTEERPKQPFIGSGHKYITPEEAKVSALEKEVRELKRANEILKEAIGFFVVSQKK
jgi:transposase